MKGKESDYNLKGTCERIEMKVSSVRSSDSG